MVFLYLIGKGCENMEKSLEQLKQEYKKTTVLLEREKRKMQRLKNRQAYLESGSRKQRTHRLITRGAAVESIAPQTKELTETEFYSLMESILNLPQAEHFIRCVLCFREPLSRYACRFFKRCIFRFSCSSRTVVFSYSCFNCSKDFSMFSHPLLIR